MTRATFSGHHMSQHPEELGAFIDLLMEHGVTRYLEIGARHGDTFHRVMLNLPRGAYGLAVDQPGALWGTTKSRKALQRAVNDLNGRGYQCQALFANSQNRATRRMVAKRGPFDALLIDADHSLPGVTKDWQLYGDLAPLVAFHDIAGEGQAEKVNGRPVEVPLLWDTIKSSHQVKEFVAPGSHMGIGVVCNST